MWAFRCLIKVLGRNQGIKTDLARTHLDHSISSTLFGFSKEKSRSMLIFFFILKAISPWVTKQALLTFRKLFRVVELIKKKKALLSGRLS